jgi:hypothetical protein
MTQIHVDDSLKEKLSGLKQSAEFCSTDGKVLGRFLPEEEYRSILYDSVEIPYSDEEISPFHAERGGCSLEEIWKRVGRT